MGRWGFEFIPVLSTVRLTSHTWKMPMLQSSISRKQKTVLSSGLFSYVFFSFQFAAFTTPCPFSCPPPSISVVRVSLGFSFVCIHVCLVILGFVFSLLLNLCCVLEFLVLPIISHGKSKDGIQPFKGPKPAARIANSLENRAY